MFIIDLFTQELVAKHCFVATDYKEEVDKWFSEDYYIENVHKIQLPFNPVTLILAARV